MVSERRVWFIWFLMNKASKLNFKKDRLSKKTLFWADTFPLGKKWSFTAFQTRIVKTSSMASRFFPIKVVGWPVNNFPKVESCVASLFYEWGKEKYLPARGLLPFFVFCLRRILECKGDKPPQCMFWTKCLFFPTLRDAFWGLFFITLSFFYPFFWLYLPVSLQSQIKPTINEFTSFISSVAKIITKRCVFFIFGPLLPRFFFFPGFERLQ